MFISDPMSTKMMRDQSQLMSLYSYNRKKRTSKFESFLKGTCNKRTMAINELKEANGSMGKFIQPQQIHEISDTLEIDCTVDTIINVIDRPRSIASSNAPAILPGSSCQVRKKNLGKVKQRKKNFINLKSN